MAGYVKLHRKCLESAVFGDSDLWRFWCWCLMKASYKQRQVLISGSVVCVEPGQFVLGRKSAAESLGVTERAVRTCLKNLEKLGNIETKTTNRFTLVTLINWELYQENEDEVTNKRPTDDQQMTNKRPTDDHKQEREEGKEGKKGKNIESNDSCASVECTDLIQTSKSIQKQNQKKQADTAFEIFWAAYPKKKGKKQAIRAWEKIKPRPTIADAEKLAQIVSLQARTPQWSKDGGEFIPLPATWLNNERWNDELETKTHDVYTSTDW